MDMQELFGPEFEGQVTPRATREGLPYPALDGDYMFPTALTKKLFRFFAGQAARNNVLLVGPAGAGKTSIIEQVAARLGWPVWGVSCSGKVRTASWLGGYALKDGQTVWQDGPLVQAMRHGGLFLADEITRLDAAEQMSLVRVLDRQDLIIPETGEVVRPHKLFRFAATGNSGGFGDESGAYAGERVASFSFIDRFLRYEVDYLPEGKEIVLVERKAPGLPTTIVETLVKLAGFVRKASATAGGGDGLRVGLSTRALISVAREAYAYQQMGLSDEPVLDALRDVVLAGAPKEEAQAVLDHARTLFSGV